MANEKTYERICNKMFTWKDWLNQNCIATCCAQKKKSLIKIVCGVGVD